MTYQLLVIGRRFAIQCLLCDRISELPGDVEQRYCGRCHLFHEHVATARAMVVDGGTHDCGEWRTFRDVCALCGRELPQ